MRKSIISKKGITALAFAAGAALTSCPAWADTVSWVGPVAGGAWGTATYWSNGTSNFVPGIGDDVTIITGTPTTAGTYTLGADRAVKSLTISSKTTLNSTANTLTIDTGNLSTTGTGWTYGGITSKIAITSGANAAWAINHGSDAFTIGAITADSTVTITKSGANLLTLNGNNSTGLHANWNVSGAKGLTVIATNALGDGLVTFTGATAVNFGNVDAPASATYANNWNINAQTVTWVTYGTSPALGKKSILTGNLTGSGTINKGTSNSDGVIVLSGSNNTFTGNITHPRGGLVLNGTFTGLGTITQTTSTYPSWLSGNGTVGMGSTKKISLTGSATLAANLAPGSDHADGTIGTLTVGTDSTNSLEMNGYSRFLVDVSPAGSDRIDLTGTLKLLPANNAMYISGTLGAGAYTLATFTASDGGKFKSVYWNAGLVGTPEADNAIGGTHKLVYGANSLTLVPVPEPTSLGLLAVGALPLLARRRRTA